MKTETMAGTTATLKVGDPAPDFTLQAHTGAAITLSSYRDRQNVVLVFHPLAFTSVCAVQIPGYNKERQSFDGVNAQVLAISVDSTPAHKAWAEQLGGIDYPLLADFWPHGAVARAYGLLRPEGTAQRATVVVDMKGIVRGIEIHEMGTIPDRERLIDFLRTLE